MYAMKRKNIYKGSLDEIPKNKIYLNINHLKNGAYILKIMHKNKLIKETHFKK